MLAQDPRGCDAGVKVEPDTGVKPQVTGPAKLPVSDKTTTRTNPDGSSVTERTICEKEMTYANDKATMVEKCTTTATTTKPDGTTETSTSESTEAKNAEKPDLDLCEKNPDILACKKLEEVKEESLPKADRNVTYAPETWFGGGSCPADKFMTIGGQEVKVWDWVESCDLLVTYGRPLILASAAFMALMILAPGVKS